MIIGIGLPRFDSRIEARPTANGLGDCWIWTGRRDDGYGRVWMNGRTVRAHVAAYTALVGPVSAGLTLDHLCHTLDTACVGGTDYLHRACCNPAHLEPITRAENTRRGRGNRQAEKTHCPSGHAYAGSNLRITPQGKRDCRTCARDKMRRRRASERAA